MAGGSLAERHDTHQSRAAQVVNQFDWEASGPLLQCFWRSADTALRRARVFWVNRSISGDLLAGQPAFLTTDVADGFEVGEQSSRKARPQATSSASSS